MEQRRAMLEAESSSSDSSWTRRTHPLKILRPIPIANRMGQMNSCDWRPHRRSSTPHRQTDRIPLAADKMTVRRHRRPVAVMTRHGADAMIAGRRRHLALVETTIGAPTVKLVTAVLVASHHPPPGSIVGAVTRYRGRHLVCVRVLCHAERAHGTETVLVITIAEEMIDRTGTGIIGVDEDVYYREYLPSKVSTSCLLSYMFIPVF